MPAERTSSFFPTLTAAQCQQLRPLLISACALAFASVLLRTLASAFAASFEQEDAEFATTAATKATELATKATDATTIPAIDSPLQPSQHALIAAFVVAALLQIHHRIQIYRSRPGHSHSHSLSHSHSHSHTRTHDRDSDADVESELPKELSALHGADKSAELMPLTAASQGALASSDGLHHSHTSGHTQPQTTPHGNSSGETGVEAYASPFRSIGAAVTALTPFSAHMLGFGAPMLLFMYIVRHPNLVLEKTADFDFFLFLMFVFFIVAFFTIRKAHSPVILNRDQTEEWKGWMQIAFLAYHYFKVKEVYNTIRILIACYVWMTGFGHVYFCAQQNKYDIVRVLRMFFRLNFMVMFVCIATDTPYMLYYICAMHTFWFLLAYGTMLIGHQYNKFPGVILAKIIAALVFVVVLFETSSVADYFFRPLSFLLEYEDDNMHEWKFRVMLDRYVPVWGMLFGYLLPKIQTWLSGLEAKGPVAEWSVKAPISVAMLAAFYYWLNEYFMLEKFTYNKVHPYTSFIPLFVYLWFRNLTPTLRTYYLELFAWWGKVTLESYISQFYILLADTTRKLLLIIPGYPFLNFLASCLLLVACSVVLFNATVFFAERLFPQDAFRTYRNILTTLIYGFSFYIIGTVLYVGLL
eukprot:TRINITY_DN1553_c0_g3_i1.p1 TRINITY_DN1553_c0_g3~~TRINITY_DN1553_c0_g3_i1.p1  ORF type:complete len:640 (+),score=137.91 TRINITY_DN1553_c0_g3_i1:52-1971(+)